MIRVQFDECFTSKRVKARCDAEGKAAVSTFPRRLRNKSLKDADVVERFSSEHSTLITTDHRLPLKQAEHIPPEHPGIIVVRNNGPHTQRERDIIEVLSTFKARVSQWDHLNYSNSIVELYQDRAEIYSIQNGNPTRSVVARFDDSNFLFAFTDALNAHLTREE